MFMKQFYDACISGHLHHKITNERKFTLHFRAKHTRTFLLLNRIIHTSIKIFKINCKKNCIPWSPYETKLTPVFTALWCWMLNSIKWWPPFIFEPHWVIKNWKKRRQKLQKHLLLWHNKNISWRHLIST